MDSSGDIAVSRPVRAAFQFFNLMRRARIQARDAEDAISRLLNPEFPSNRKQSLEIGHRRVIDFEHHVNHLNSGLHLLLK